MILVATLFSATEKGNNEIYCYVVHSGVILSMPKDLATYSQNTHMKSKVSDVNSMVLSRDLKRNVLVFWSLSTFTN